MQSADLFPVEWRVPAENRAPAGYRVFRVHKPTLADDVGLMGPAKIQFDDPHWRDYDVPLLNGKPEQIRHGRAITRAVTLSWHPYYYRVVARPCRSEDR